MLKSLWKNSVLSIRPRALGRSRPANGRSEGHFLALLGRPRAVQDRLLAVLDGQKALGRPRAKRAFSTVILAYLGTFMVQEGPGPSLDPQRAVLGGPRALPGPSRTALLAVLGGPGPALAGPGPARSAKKQAQDGPFWPRAGQGLSLIHI